MNQTPGSRIVKVRQMRRRGAVFLTILIVLTGCDALLGLAFHTNSNADIQIVGRRSSTTQRAIVVFPGYIMSGAVLGQAFAPHIDVDDTLVVVNYAQRGMNVNEICDQVLVALRSLQPVELRVYGASMGGMLAKLCLDQYRQAGAPYGKVILVLDSAPAVADDVKRPGVLFDLSCWYRGGPLSTAVWATVSAFVTKPQPEEDASPALVRAAHHAGAWVGMPAATSQACFIASVRPPRPGDLLDIAQQVVYLQGRPPDDDPLVRISASIERWRVAFPHLRVVTIQSRAGQWHLPLVERPSETVAALLAPF